MSKTKQNFFDKIKEFCKKPKVSKILAFFKDFGMIIGTHIIMSVLPLFFLSILNNSLNQTVKAARGAGELLVYSIYFLLFIVAYFFVGRVAGGSREYERRSMPSVLARAVSSVIIAALGLVVLYLVQVPSNIESAWLVVFALPQLMARRAIVEGIIGNLTFATVMMIMPMILIWIGFFSNGFDFKKKKRGKK